MKNLMMLLLLSTPSFALEIKSIDEAKQIPGFEGATERVEIVDFAEACPKGIRELRWLDVKLKNKTETFSTLLSVDGQIRNKKCEDVPYRGPRDNHDESRICLETHAGDDFNCGGQVSGFSGLSIKVKEKFGTSPILYLNGGPSWLHYKKLPKIGQGHDATQAGQRQVWNRAENDDEVCDYFMYADQHIGNGDFVVCAIRL